MNWQEIQRDYNSSFIKDVNVKSWLGTKHNVSVHRCQEWAVYKGKDFFLSPDINIKDIYLDHAIIAKGWRGVYGIPKLSDFVKPTDRKIIEKQWPFTVRNEKPWGVYAGKNECQYMYPKILEIFDIVTRYICSLYPRNCNEAFVLGDAGCMVGKTCPGHGGAHDNLCTIDLNYCTLSGFNMTHYSNSNMPNKYDEQKIDIWKDSFPYRHLKTDIFDTEKNYALYYLLKQIFPRGSFLTSVGINDHFKKIYGGSVLQGDDNKDYKHYWHVHLYLWYNEINWDVEIKPYKMNLN